MVVLVDDEGRENEGDLVCAAEHVSPETVNFMLREGRGMLFAAVDAERCDKLDLPPQAAVNTTQRGTAYTITVDAGARHGLTTGVSTMDRAMTLRLLADPAATAADFDRPGHIQPLRARHGGVLVRAGHTEGSVDLCRLAGLQPVAVGIEVMNDDGSMARQPALEDLCKRHDLKICSVADVIEHRLQRQKLIERVEAVPFRNDAGDWTLIAYRSLVDPLPHVVLACGDVGRVDDLGCPVELPDPVLVRMHSQNLLGDVLGDTTQPSGETLRASMRMIQQAGRGAVVYLRHEAMGTGLLQRLQTPRADAKPSAEEDADESIRLGTDEHHPPPPDAPPTTHTRAYGIGSQILRDLGVRRLRLITDHPITPHALGGFGLTIEAFVPVDRERGTGNREQD